MPLSWETIRRHLPWVLPCLVPVCSVAWVILRYAMPFPHDDMLTMLPLNLPSTDGWSSAYLRRIVANEHQVFFPGLLFRPLHLWLFPGELVAFSPGHYRLIYAESFAIALLNAFLLLVLVRRTATDLTVAGRRMLAVLCVSFVFSLSFWTMWIWNGRTFYFSVTCMLAAVVVLSSQRPRSRLYAGVCAFLGTFSLGSGIAAWPALLPAMLARTPAKRRWVVGAVWCALAAIALGAYVFLWRSHPVAHVYMPQDKSYVWAVGRFIVHLLGSFSTPGRHPMMAVGGSLVLGLLLALSLWRYRRDISLRSRLLPWICVAAFGFGAACIIAVGRVGFGWTAAFWPRYNSLTYPFALGSIAAFCIAFPRAWRVQGVITLLLLALQIHWFFTALAPMRGERERIARGYSCLLAYPVAADSCLHLLHRDPQVDVRSFARLAQRLGLLETFGLPTDRIRRVVPPVGFVDQILSTSSGETVLRGWSVLPECRSPRHIAVTAQNGAQLIGLTTAVFRRTDVPCGRDAGWELTLHPRFGTPEQIEGLEVWAYDDREEALLRLVMPPL